MVARTNVHVVGVEVIELDLAGDGLGLGDFLRLETVAVEHVLKVHVPADVELVRAVQREAAVFEESREHAVDNRRTDLALDVITDDGHTRVAELLGPHGVRGDEDWNGVHEGDAGVNGRLGVVALCVFRAHGQVGDENVGLGFAQGARHVNGLKG